ncbi:MAG: DUF928 domain-containing protein [Symploca sp. SIO2C1]|nr:DUF928 domain-containing protein [Symploca sp. SIO2C1]
MVKNKLYSHLTNISVALCVSLAVMPYQVKAQTQARIQTATRGTFEEALTIQFEPPPEKGIPTQTVGGGTRGQCSLQQQDTKKPLTLLTPAAQEGLTMAERPTFFFYVPETSAQKAEFTLISQDEEYGYQTSFSLDSKGGVFKFQLPAEAAPLEVGKSYQWSVAMICNQQQRTEDIVAQGLIQRTEATPTLVTQLGSATPLQRAALYGKAGIWYDTVKTMAELQISQPNDSNLVTAWRQLLRSKYVKLDDIAQAPIIDCCDTN